jgi:cell division protein FtsW (lipid II flippase)
MIAQKRYGDPYHFLRPQVMAVLIGLVAMIIAKNIPYKVFCRLSTPFY